MNNGQSRNTEGNSDDAARGARSAFVPVLLVTISLVVVLGWNVMVSVRQNDTLQRVKFQVWQAEIQSEQAESKLKVMLTDLVELAKEDAAAALIVKRYKIQNNAPSATTPAPDVKPKG